MKKLTIFASCLAILATAVFVVQNLSQGRQSTFVDRGNDSSVYSSVNSDSDSININSQDDSDMKDPGTFVSQQQSSQSSQSSNGSYQKSSSSVSLRAVDVRQPHILKIDSSGTQFVGKVTIDGKVAKKLDSKISEINLSPYLSVGEHTVEISGRYSPGSSSIKVELKGPGTNVTQQSSGNGVVNHSMTVTVQ
jgi:predicted lysophospholipase L1 biosynthesis ABC-type transport system permease subunit